MEFIELLEKPHYFISPKFFSGVIEKKEGKIDWERSPLILPSKGLSRVRCESWFAEKNIRPYIYSQVAGNEAIIAMVAMGCGIGLVPKLVLEQSNARNEVEILPDGPRLQPFIVGACTNSDNMTNSIIQSFWEILRQKPSAQSVDI
jgi:LysR family positive regulator for ilvC